MHRRCTFYLAHFYLAFNIIFICWFTEQHLTNRELIKYNLKQFLTDFSKLIKFRLTFLVVFSASVTFLIGSKVSIEGVAPGIDWTNWLILIAGGFLVTSAANCFNEVIEVDLDKLMTRTKDRPMPAGHMTTGQGLVSGLVMGMLGTWLLGK